MKRAAWAALGLILTAGAAFGSASGDLGEELNLLQRGLDRARANDCDGAFPLLKQVVDAPLFSRLNNLRQYTAAHALASCAYDKDDYATALKMLRLATASDSATRDDWYLRTVAAWMSGDKDDAARSLEHLVAWPDLISHLRIRTLYAILNDSQGTPEGDARNARIVKALFDAHWRPVNEPADYADGLWERHVRYLLKAGNVAEARQAAAAITSPEFVVTARSQKLFDPLTTADPARYDIRKAHEAAAVRLKARVAATPDKLEPVSELALMLYQLDRPAEGLALVDQTFAAIKSGKVFADQADQLNWLYDWRAMLLTALGRADEAIAAYKAGAEIGEYGFNVSQVINLAETYCDLGRPAEAIEVLTGFNPKHASPYGNMAAEGMRVCAYAQLSDKPQLARSLDFIRAHAGDAPGVAVEALLYAGEENEAAALALKFLGEEKNRNLILKRLHHAMPPAKDPGMPFDTLVHARWQALAKRPEIVQAVGTFGHILEIPLVATW